MQVQFLKHEDAWMLTLRYVRTGGEAVARELMAITGISAQELARLARAEAHAVARRTVTDRTAADIAEAVMGSKAWNTYKNTDSKNLKGPRKPEARGKHEKRTKALRSKLGGSLAGWTLQNQPEHFAGTDTEWTMDQTLTWIPPDTCTHDDHIGTLGNMISEAFHQHKKFLWNARSNPRHRLRQLKVQIGMTTPAFASPTSSNPRRNSILHQFDLYIFNRLTYLIN